VRQGDPRVSLGVAQGVARLDTTGRLHLGTPPNQQTHIGLHLQPDLLTGAQRRVGLSALNVANRATELRIAANERNMVRVYLLTRETPSMSKVKKKSKKQPSMTTKDIEEEFVTGDNGHSLMGRRICLKPRKVEGDDGQ
jgi:hypothetical protein